MTGEHLTRLETAIARLRDRTSQVEGWGARLAEVLTAGGRLLVCGNGGSAAQAQHLSAELVGRFQRDREPFAALALHTDTSTLTAIVNDYGPDEVFARQVRAHGRPGDILLCLSTSGESANVIAAAKTGNELELRTWGLTGPLPNPLAGVCEEVLNVETPVTATVQEIHLAVIHMLCFCVDRVVLLVEPVPGRVPQRTFRGRNCTLTRGPAARADFGTACSQVRWQDPPITSRSPWPIS